MHLKQRGGHLLFVNHNRSFVFLLTPNGVIRLTIMCKNKHDYLEYFGSILLIFEVS